MNEKIYSVFLLLLLLLLSGCKDLEAEKQARLAKYRAEARFGYEYDSVRVKLGIPTISKEWEVSFVSKERENYTKEDKYPYHFSKSVFIDEKGCVEKEVDYYYSGQRYENLAYDGSSLRLMVIYDYKKEGEKFSYKYNAEGVFDREITKEQADSLMASWGISYDG